MLAIFSAFVSLLIVALLEKADSQSSNPSAALRPVFLMTVEGANQTITCVQGGSPPLTVQWYKDDQLLSLPSVYFRLSSSRTQLTLLRIQFDVHNGNYHCTVTNQFGTAKSNVLPVSVFFLGEEFFFLNGTETIYDVPPLNKVFIDCGPPRGFRPPFVGWFKDGNILFPVSGKVEQVDFSDESGVIVRSQLTVFDAVAGDAGFYECAVSNPAGTRRSGITVTFRGVPDPPSNFRTGNVTSDSIDVSWDPLERPDITSYEVEVRQQIDVQNTRREYVDKAASSFVVKNLKVGTNYQSSVRAVDLANRGTFSDRVLTATGGADKCDLVADFRVRIVSVDCTANEICGGPASSITANGGDELSLRGTGHNCVTFNYSTGNVLQRVSYDVASGDQAIIDFSNFVKNIPVLTVVACAVVQSPRSPRPLSLVGANYPWNYDGGAFAFLGYKSESYEGHFGFVPWMQTVYSADRKGVRIIDQSFKLGSYSCDRSFSCRGKPDGNYANPTNECYYIACVAEVYMYCMSCPSGFFGRLRYDSENNYCV